MGPGRRRRVVENTNDRWSCDARLLVTLLIKPHDAGGWTGVTGVTAALAPIKNHHFLSSTHALAGTRTDRFT